MVLYYINSAIVLCYRGKKKFVSYKNRIEFHTFNEPCIPHSKLLTLLRQIQQFPTSNKISIRRPDDEDPITICSIDLGSVIVKIN